MLTPDDIRAAKAAGRKLACLTAYDYPTARLLDESGVDLILVGDEQGAGNAAGGAEVFQAVAEVGTEGDACTKERHRKERNDE